MHTLIIILVALIVLVALLPVFHLTLGATKFLVQINYKSGIQTETWFRTFKIDRDGHLVTSYKCTFYNGIIKTANRPIHIDVSQIESIWQHSYRKSIWSFFGFDY